jgi:hypothetical protein
MNPAGQYRGAPRRLAAGWALALGATLVLAAGCGGRQTGLVRFDPDPPGPADHVHQVEYQASCQSGAECVVSFRGPEGEGREIFGSQWSHQIHASTGQELYLGVTVRRFCSGTYALGNVRCRRASGSARVALFVDGERVVSKVEHARDRRIRRDASFTVSVRHRIVPDSTASPAGP